MTQDFLHTTFGKTGKKIFRLGLSTTYRPGKDTIYKAIDAGVNLFFGYGFDTQMFKVLRDVMKKNREKYVVVTGAYNMILSDPNFEKILEKRLRQLRTDYIDVFMFLGVMKEKHFPEDLRERMQRLKETGKVHHIGISCHDRKLLGKLSDTDGIDVMMARYNAAHRGAEQDIFPLVKTHNTGIISYTATRWGYLLRKPNNYPKDGRLPTPGMCYRFVLSNPDVHCCLSAPKNNEHLMENLKAVNEGPLNQEEMDFMIKFGDVVHKSKKWFM